MVLTEASRYPQRAWFEHKSLLMERSLGKPDESVMHSIIPYDSGGALDLYYYPHHLTGTGIATKELSILPGVGPSNDVYSSYELVMFTKRSLDLAAALDPSTEFGRAHASLNGVLNGIARLSEDATLNPGETCEFPTTFETIGGKCVVFDGYAVHSDDVVQNFGLLLIIEVFRSEMNFARRRGGGILIKRLMAEHYYPYSDLDRKPVA